MFFFENVAVFQTIRHFTNHIFCFLILISHSLFLHATFYSANFTKPLIRYTSTINNLQMALARMGRAHATLKGNAKAAYNSVIRPTFHRQSHSPLIESLHMRPFQKILRGMVDVIH